MEFEILLFSPLTFKIIIWTFKLQAWAPDLTKLGEVQAHPCSVYSIAASDDTLYSCSNEGTVKSFDLTTLKEKEVLAQDDKSEFWRVCYSNGALFAGDSNGNVSYDIT